MASIYLQDPDQDYEFANYSEVNSVVRHFPFYQNQIMLVEQPESLRSITHYESYDLGHLSSLSTTGEEEPLPIFHEQSSRFVDSRVETPQGPQQIIKHTIDAYVVSFLQYKLGHEKYNIFTGRLCDRKNSSRHKASSNYPSSVDYLVKTEVVKQVLREYVPHPYNSVKAMSHPYAGAPSGSVTLTRSTVLHLSGWSNTQFSYWARRSEALTVLQKYHPQMTEVGRALQSSLYQKRIYASSSTDNNRYDRSLGTSYEMPPQEIYALHHDHIAITGKGLDHLIDEVKQKTGLSPFLRGKHCSLDPYSSTPKENTHKGNVPKWEETSHDFNVQPELFYHPVGSNLPIVASHVGDNMSHPSACVASGYDYHNGIIEFSVDSDFADSPPGSFEVGMGGIQMEDSAAAQICLNEQTVPVKRSFDTFGFQQEEFVKCILPMKRRRP